VFKCVYGRGAKGRGEFLQIDMEKEVYSGHQTGSGMGREPKKRLERGKKGIQEKKRGALRSKGARLPRKKMGTLYLMNVRKKKNTVVEVTRSASTRTKMSSRTRGEGRQMKTDKAPNLVQDRWRAEIRDTDKAEKRATTGVRVACCLQRDDVPSPMTVNKTNEERTVRKEERGLV